MWLNKPAVTVQGIHMEVADLRAAPPAPTPTPIVGLPY